MSASLPYPGYVPPNPSLPRSATGAVDLSGVLSGYEGKWVALTRDMSVVVASGENHDECDDAVVAKQGTTEGVVFLRIPPKGVKLIY